jgi:hypothetical protein
MIRHLLLWIAAAGATASLCGQAWAQAQLQSEQGLAGMGSDPGYTGSIATRAPLGQQTGVKVSESSLLHVGIGAEGGYDSNVFYTDQNQIGAPLLRVTPFIELTNATREGAVPSGVYYDLSLNLQYREYLTDDPETRAQRAFNPSASGFVEMSSGRAFSFSLSDTFVRSEEPPYNESTAHITRDSNIASVQLKFAPGGGRLQGTLRYTNLLDVYETGGWDKANHMGHEGMLEMRWLWLPKTALYVQFSQGYIHYLESDSGRSNSAPLRALAGLRGLLTDKVALNFGVGYANAFYSTGTSTSGLSNLAGLLELTYKPTLLTSLLLGYRHEFRNSIIGNFADVDAVYFSLAQQIASRISLGLHAKYELRRYKGLPGDVPRTDNYTQAGAQADYFVQEWLYAGIGYLLLLNRTDADTTLGGGVQYTKHLILGRLGFIY